MRVRRFTFKEGGCWLTFAFATATGGGLVPKAVARENEAVVKTVPNAHIPDFLVALSEENTQDQEGSLAELFEWVGMACLGSPR